MVGGGGTGVSRLSIFPFIVLSAVYQGGDEGRTWDRKGMLSMGLMAMFIFMGMEVVRATGWAMFMPADEGMLTGPVMVTGWWRLTGELMFTVLVEMFIADAMVMGLLLEIPRFIAVVMGAEAVTGVAEAELQTLLLSGGQGERGASQSMLRSSPCQQCCCSCLLPQHGRMPFRKDIRLCERTLDCVKGH